MHSRVKDRAAAILAVATMPPREDKDEIDYFDKADVRDLWTVELHRRACEIRVAMETLAESVKPQDGDSET